jgi:hypothetical protein
MAQITKAEIYKNEYDFLTVVQYAKKYGAGISTQAVYYAIEKGHLDHLELGRDKLVVMTEHSKTYVPNASKKRMSL